MEHIVGAAVGLVLGLALGLIVLALLGFVLQWLWNTTLPEVLGVREVTLVQAIKILLIASILFGGHRVVTVQEPEQPTAKSSQAASVG